MEIKQKTIVAKERKLSAKWTVESMDDAKDFWKIHEVYPPENDKMCNSVIEAIFREVWHRWQYRRYHRHGIDVQKELEEALAAEITEAINDQILKSLQVPKDKL